MLLWALVRLFKIYQQRRQKYLFVRYNEINAFMHEAVAQSCRNIHQQQNRMSRCVVANDFKLLLHLRWIDNTWVFKLNKQKLLP
jgi:hypothetical protein